MRLQLLAAQILIISACGNTANNTSTPRDVQAQDLWAGRVTATVERETEDPCGRRFSADLVDVPFSDWARQRASYTNLCFEVWRPGVTDQENPDFWRLLDVKAHYRWATTNGPFGAASVNSLKRVGNNRQYAFDLRPIDPFVGNCAGSTVPFKITWEDETEFSAEVKLEVFFSVNGHELKKPDGKPYTVLYSGQCPKRS